MQLIRGSVTFIKPYAQAGFSAAWCHRQTGEKSKMSDVINKNLYLIKVKFTVSLFQIMSFMFADLYNMLIAFRNLFGAPIVLDTVKRVL